MENKIENILLIVLLALVFSGLVYALSSFLVADKTINNAIPQNLPNSNSGAKTSERTKTSESDVTIDITPKEFKDGKLYFDIGVNTHSVSLDDYDLKTLTTLEFEGSSIKPASAPKLNGHHNSGTLVFDTSRELKNFKITIKGIPEINERVFEWP